MGDTKGLFRVLVLVAVLRGKVGSVLLAKSDLG
ncbi:hypothetical protein AXFE_12640 [Acidithrix ferrooxidans]|uniref:Uncharacterized protein n=1 Tax=Acidithrix ferrooxidans TaxID=1280514 RepID=A0A0D8HJ48_9ACTN|nr:hypothetical protein AXFE_12640 [Acidithrix ferrooxidans]